MKALMKARPIFTYNSVLSIVGKLLQPLQQERKTEKERERMEEERGKEE